MIVMVELFVECVHNAANKRAIRVSNQGILGSAKIKSSSHAIPSTHLIRYYLSSHSNSFLISLFKTYIRISNVILESGDYSILPKNSPSNNHNQGTQTRATNPLISLTSTTLSGQIDKSDICYHIFDSLGDIALLTQSL